MAAPQKKSPNTPDLIERVIRVNRVAKVVKGGRRFSFSALVVIGDGNNKVGYGHGKANEVTEAIRKAVLHGTKNMSYVHTAGRTLIHPLFYKKGASKIFMRPCPPGSGIIASGSLRAVMEACGIQDVSAKSLGSQNPHNVIKAALSALKQMKPHSQIAKDRGIPLEHIQIQALPKNESNKENPAPQAN